MSVPWAFSDPRQEAPRSRLTEKTREKACDLLELSVSSWTPSPGTPPPVTPGALWACRHSCGQLTGSMAPGTSGLNGFWALSREDLSYLKPAI